jgi:hypothetical protein
VLTKQSKLSTTTERTADRPVGKLSPYLLAKNYSVLRKQAEIHCAWPETDTVAGLSPVRIRRSTLL